MNFLSFNQYLFGNLKAENPFFGSYAKKEDPPSEVKAAPLCAPLAVSPSRCIDLAAFESISEEQILDLLMPDLASPKPDIEPPCNTSPKSRFSPKLNWEGFIKSFEELANQDVEMALELANAQVTQTTGEELISLYQYLAKFTLDLKRYEEAKHYYRMLCFYEPHALYHWTQIYKIEMIKANYETALGIIEKAFVYFPMNPQLLELSIPCLSYLGKLDEIRKIVGGIDQSKASLYTKVLILAAKEEAKDGNCDRAREIFKLIIRSDPFCISSLSEIILQEMHWLNFNEAIFLYNQFIQNENLRKFARLWEIIIQMHGCIGVLTGCINDNHLNVATSALSFIEPSLYPKIHLACAKIEMQKGNFEAARYCFSQIYSNMPKEDQAKYRSEEMLMELYAGDVARARKIQQELGQMVPKEKTKTILSLLIDFALMEDFLGNTDLAIQILNSGVASDKYSSKDIKLLNIQKLKIYIRNGRFAEGLAEAEEIYKRFPDICYLLIQLRHLNGLDSGNLFFKDLPGNSRAGEYLCEGARLAMNPFSSIFDLNRAEKYLEKALLQTPQDGDIWIELLRLMIIKYGPDVDTSKLELRCAVQRPMFGTLWLYCGASRCELPIVTLRLAKSLLLQEINQHRSLYDAAIQKKAVVPTHGASKSDFIAALPSYCRFLHKGLKNIGDGMLNFKLAFYNRTAKK